MESTGCKIVIVSDNYFSAKVNVACSSYSTQWRQNKKSAYTATPALQVMKTLFYLPCTMLNQCTIRHIEICGCIFLSSAQMSHKVKGRDKQLFYIKDGAKQ